MRIYTNEISQNIGKEITVKGFVQELRDLKNIKFILLRDVNGAVQAVAHKKFTEPESFASISKTNIESSALITGKVEKNKEAKQGYELKIEKFEIINNAESLPIDISDKTNTGLDTRLDYRFLDLKKLKIQGIFKIQSTIMAAFREFMQTENAFECVFPSIIQSSSEGGTELYKLKYFEKDAYLSQSCQLYKQMLACSMEKVFTLFTVWRAEKHNTTQHLNESRQLDFEAGFSDDKEVMGILGKCVQHIITKVLDKNKQELALLEVKLKVPEIKYITFSEVKTLMEKNKIEMEEHDLSKNAEKKLNELFPDTIIFVHDWPIAGKPFYIMEKEKGLSAGFDAIYKGVEISSGGQRVHLPEILIKRLKAQKLDPVQFKSYIDSFRYGAPPHAGWGLGLERLTMVITGVDNIREVVLFPRDRDRLTP